MGRGPATGVCRAPFRFSPVFGAQPGGEDYVGFAVGFGLVGLPAS